MSSSHLTLSAASDDRKARLAKLKTLKRKQPEDEVAPPESDRASPALPEKDVGQLHLSGRNYDPETKGPKLGFEAPPTLNLETPTLEERAEDLEVEVRKQAAEDEKADKGIDLFNLQPKKPNWDLKRELDKKMEVLNVRTDNAIAKLVRERLAAKKAAAQKTGERSDADSTGLEGAELVEGIRMREQEEAEEERREKEEDDLA